MSGPNTQYDPVEVAALDPAALDAAVREATAARRGRPPSTSSRRRGSRTRDRSALALANREIGALPPSAKAEAGKRVGPARGRLGRALAARQAELEAERDARVLVEETVDVTCRRAGARPAPGTRWS